MPKIGYKQTEEHNKKISLSHIGKSWGNHTEESKLKISISNLGKKRKPYSEEHKRKISFAKIGEGGWKLSEETRKRQSLSRIGDKNTFYGRKHTKETKKKMSLAKKGKTYEEIYGIEKAKELKGKKRLIMLGDKNPCKRLEIRAKVSKRLKGRKLSEEIRKKIMFKRMFQVIPIKDTSIEIKMQNELRNRGIVFVTHKPIIGQPDVFIEPNICVFCDGDYWHNTNWSKNRDKYVNSKLSEKGYFIIRLWEHEINSNIKDCVDKIIFLSGQTVSIPSVLVEKSANYVEDRKTYKTASESNIETAGSPIQSVSREEGIEDESS